jgi:hypothetical protein
MPVLRLVACKPCGSRQQRMGTHHILQNAGLCSLRELMLLSWRLPGNVGFPPQGRVSSKAHCRALCRDSYFFVSGPSKMRRRFGVSGHNRSQSRALHCGFESLGTPSAEGTGARAAAQAARVPHAASACDTMHGPAAKYVASSCWSCFGECGSSPGLQSLPRTRKSGRRSTLVPRPAGPFTRTLVWMPR